MPVNKETLKIAQKVLKIFTGCGLCIMEKDCESNWCFTLQHYLIPQGGLYVDIRNPEKYTFSGRWPFVFGFGSFSPDETKTATVSRTKYDELIRKDVQRRVLDWYYPQLQVQIERMNRYLNSVSIQDALKKELCALLEIDLPTLSSDTIRPLCNGIKEIQINHEGSHVRFSTISIPKDVAKEVFELLKRKLPK